MANLFESNKLEHFNFWCQKVLPLVYDDSLSYYEVLCKVVAYINALITDSNNIISDIDELKKEIEIINNWINNFNEEEIKKYVEQYVDKYIATMIFVEISKAGYIIYNIPESWNDITFNTTGLDIEINNIDYGCLVLSY